MVRKEAEVHILITHFCVVVILLRCGRGVLRGFVLARLVALPDGLSHLVRINGPSHPGIFTSSKLVSIVSEIFSNYYVIL